MPSIVEARTQTFVNRLCLRQFLTSRMNGTTDVIGVGRGRKIDARMLILIVDLMIGNEGIARFKPGVGFSKCVIG